MVKHVNLNQAAIEPSEPEGTREGTEQMFKFGESVCDPLIKYVQSCGSGCQELGSFTFQDIQPYRNCLFAS